MVLPEFIRMATAAAGARWAYGEGEILRVGVDVSEGQAAKFLESGAAVAVDSPSEPKEEPVHQPVEAAVVEPPENAALRTGKLPGRRRTR